MRPLTHAFTSSRSENVTCDSCGRRFWRGGRSCCSPPSLQLPVSSLRARPQQTLPLRTFTSLLSCRQADEPPYFQQGLSLSSNQPCILAFSDMIVDQTTSVFMVPVSTPALKP